MKKIYLAFCLIGLISVSAVAQLATPRWTAVFQGSGDYSDRFNKVISDGSGNFIGVGYTIKKGNYKDILIVKFDSAGDTLWWRTKNGKGSGDDEGVAVSVDATGNVYVAGTVDADNSGDDIITMKFASNGALLWDTTWDSSNILDDRAVDLKLDGAGNCIVGGNTEPDTVSGNNDIVMLKYAPNGTLLWETIWTRPGITAGKDELASIAIDNSNQIYGTGRSFGSSDDFILLQFDNSTGAVIWNMPYNGGGEDRATSVKVDNAGDIVISGSSDNGSNLDFRINKYNNTGLLQWTRSLSAPALGDEVPAAMVIDGSDNIYVTGYADVASGATINYDFQTVKYNSAGTLQWVRRDGSPFMKNDDANDITLDGSGNIYVTGKSDQNISPLSTNFDFMTVAYSPAGSPIWGPLYHSGTRSGADDVASAIVFDSGNVYTCGGAVNNGTHKDATVVKYDAAAGNVIWVKDYNGTGDLIDEVKAMVVDQNNITYVAGSTFHENQNLNACISKIDNAGTVLCTYEYNGVKNDDDEFKAIALSSNGNIYAAGYTKVTGQKRNMLLMKWNPNTCDTSNIGWTRTYDYINKSDRIESMVLDNSGNIYITGRSDANPIDTVNGDDIVTIKYDSNGNVLWLSRYDGPAHMKDEPVKIIFDNAGDLVIGGRTENIHDDDFIVLKYNPVDGLLRAGFPVTYGGPFSNDDRVTDIAIDPSNNIFVAGYSQTGSGNATQDPTMIAYDASGTIIPSVFFIYSALNHDEIVSIKFDTYGDLYLLNKFADGSGPVVNYDYVLHKFNSNMDNIWTRIYDDSIHGDDVPDDMAITPSGDVYITGTSDNDTLLGAINKNWVTLGYDTAGNQIFMANANGPNSTDDSPKTIKIRGTTIWVGGYTEGLNNNQKDLTVISYDLPLGISASPSDNINNSTAFPNPFNENCTITINFSGEKMYFELFDMLGNIVSDKMLVEGNVVHFNKGNLANGIYQYRIISQKSIVSTGKLIIN